MSDNNNRGKKLVRRVHALRRLQADIADIEGKYSNAVMKLEEKYFKNSRHLLERRRQIVCGEYEPKGEETNYPLTYVNVPDRGEDESYLEDVKGIPSFWLTVFNNIPVLWTMIHRQDADALTYLTDVTSESNVTEGGFALKFHFAQNKYFKNKVLTKTYVVRYGKKDNDAFNIYGPEMVDCIGCEIEWKSQDLTVTIKNKKLVKRPSFFNFFDPPKLSEDPKLKPYILNHWMTDFQLGHYLKGSIIPKAILYYLGEAVLRECFGFKTPFVKEEEEEETLEDWPSSFDRKSILEHGQSRIINYEQDLIKWQKSEKLLARRLAERKFEKAENFEESKLRPEMSSNLDEGSEEKKKQGETVTRKVKGRDIDTTVGKKKINPADLERVLASMRNKVLSQTKEQTKKGTSHKQRTSKNVKQKKINKEPDHSEDLHKLLGKKIKLTNIQAKLMNNDNNTEIPFDTKKLNINEDMLNKELQSILQSYQKEMRKPKRKSKAQK